MKTPRVHFIRPKMGQLCFKFKSRLILWRHQRCCYFLGPFQTCLEIRYVALSVSCSHSSFRNSSKITDNSWASLLKENNDVSVFQKHGADRNMHSIRVTLQLTYWLHDFRNGTGSVSLYCYIENWVGWLSLETRGKISLGLLFTFSFVIF